MDNQYRNSDRWPKAGASASDLLKAYNYLLVDADLMESIGFQKFYSEWVSVYGNRRRIYIQTLSGDTTRVPPGCSMIQPLQAARLDEYPAVLRGLGKNWLYLTKSSEKAEAMRSAVFHSGVYLRVYGLDDEGKLESYRPPMKEKRQTVFSDREDNLDRYGLPNKIVPINRVAFRSPSVPAERDSVYDSSRRSVLLGSEFSSNPQSITYQTNISGMQAKIYQKEWLQISYFKDKAERMIRTPLNMEGICWPTDLLYNANGEFVGILVPKAEGLQSKIASAS